jgi:hypothetical protein
MTARRVAAFVLGTGMLVAFACNPTPKKESSPEDTGGSSGEETGGSPGTGGAKGGTGGAKGGTGGSPATGGAPGTGGSPATGGAPGTGGSPATGGAPGTGGRDAGAGGTGGGAGGTGGAGSGGASGTDCASTPGLTWKTARKSWYTSYPAPGSKECIVYSGCQYQGMFQACSGVKSKAWVMSHNIAAFFPLGNMSLHDICIKAAGKSMIVTVYDTCGDSDCNGCCTKNKGNNDALVDLESFTNMRWGMDDGVLQWADLGPTKGGGCAN